MNKFNRVKFIAMGLLIGVGLCFLAAEVILRVLDDREPDSFHLADPHLGYAIRPRYDGDEPELYGIPRRVNVKVNSLGFRGPEVAIDKPPNTTRIVLLGDSCTFGLGLHRHETFADITQKLLDGLGSAEHRYEVINAGVPGYTSFQGLQMLRHRVLDLSPDVMTIYFGWNDHWFARYEKPDSLAIPEQREAVRRRRAKRNPLQASRVFQRISNPIYLDDKPKPKPKVRIHRVPLPEYEKHVRAIIIEAQENNIRPIVITAPHGFFPGRIPKNYLIRSFMNRDDSLIQLHESYTQSIRTVASEAGAVVLDMAHIFEEAGREQLMEKDGIHPNASGHRIIARELFSLIRGRRPGARRRERPRRR